MADYSKPPSSVKIPIKPFKAHQKIKDFQTLLSLSPIAPPNYENSDKSVDRRYGVSHAWITHAKSHWQHNFNWRAHEDHINSFPNFTAQVQDDESHDFEIHFVALFSQKADAIPLVFYHGWPGSFLEFLPICKLLTQKYTPQTLPYHIIVPSIPGYAYSSSPPLNFDFSLENASEALNNLMIGLGFDKLGGYIAQGGDLGSMISRYQAANCEACRGMHLNFSPISRPANAEELAMGEVEREAISRGLAFREMGSAYAHEHGTRTATIGMCLSASPLALLAWIGEKFLEWSDEDPPLDEILESITLYWMTDTFARCIYPYRGLSGDEERPRIAKVNGRGRARPYVEKPSGYSFFPKELVPMPVSWVATSCNLISSAIHSSGGHFAAMEKPKELLGDVEEFVRKACKVSAGGKL
ncbi:related to epoxide hydrolase [Ramularia collo-cygni]|uniref:Related to epoxide hydrolase n=1 Tax=Ramularia collo-cygni TaxID=112498 RepID=A0A2D3V270_9PEZI|nr:related to epoxide hydrolase [Ramularia collo-cygni]CZT23476.1 related to epoxide hydrolase [Ramularia collo-cygni]